MIRTAALAAAASLAVASAASAQNFSGLSFDAGVGLRYSPEYVGSDDYDAKPWLILRNVSFAPTASGTPANGFHISPSANYVGKRDSSDNDKLEGLDDIDRTVELGVRAGYRFGQLDTFVAVRKGLGGHKGVVGEVGVDYTIPVSPKLTLTTGLEAEYGNGRYADAYFGVSDEESARSGYDAFDAGGGFNAIAADVGARYELNDDWAVLGQVRVSRLIGDAADSPIVEDRDRYSVGLGVVRHFSFSF